MELEFQPNPETIECGAEELTEAEFESAYEITLALVVLTENSAFAAAPAHGCEAAVVETHEPEKWPRFPW